MEFLLEIATEEMPSAHVRSGLAQLDEKIKAELEAAHIEVSWIKTYGTCRRLVVCGDFAAQQPDQEEVVIGPPKAIAYAADGAPTSAAKGFAKAQNVDLDRLEVISTPRGEYVAVRKTIRGKPLGEILARALPGIILALSFPKMMRWGTGRLRFSRPIKSLLCLCGGRPLRFSLDGIRSSNWTTGHKLQAPRKFVVRSFGDYSSQLVRRGVILDELERRRRILAQAKKKLAPIKAELYPDETLLDKLAIDVEHPYVIVGSFPEAYLDLPLEILSVAMREGQKLFSVVRAGRQLPYFVGVADVRGDPKSLIRKGNERVLRARLEDARFFWQNDRKVPLAERASGLDQIIFQQKLGSYAAKVERLAELVSFLCDRLEERALKPEAILAARLCKADLLTEMVREFPSLQGRVGGLYARAEGYSEAVWRAIYEHYQPASLEEAPPDSKAGALLALADKLDSIVGVLGSGETISGSSDPFGLRRNAHGIGKIVLEHKFDFPFVELLEKAISGYGGILPRPAAEVISVCLDFFAQRLRFLFEAKGYRYDFINAALGPGIDSIFRAFLRLEALQALSQSPRFERLILMARRVNNILRGLPAYTLDPGLFDESEERELYSVLIGIREKIKPFLSQGEFLRVQKEILKLEGPLGRFFDRVLVMAEDEKLRRNRLALLQELRHLFAELADFSRLVLEEDRAS